MCPVIGTWGRSQNPIPGSQPRLNLTAVLTHRSEATLSFEDISRPGVRSHLATQSRLDTGPNAPPLWRLYPSPRTDRGELLRTAESVL